MSSILKVDQLQDSGGNNLVTSNGSGVITSSAFGKVLQVVSASTTTGVDTTSSTYSSTGFSISITPSSTSSKILLMMNPHFRLYNNSGADADGFYKINDGSSDIYESKLQIYDYGNSGSIINVTPSIVHLDSPSTTSQKTYTFFIRLQNGVKLQFSHGSRVSNAIAMEISAWL